MARAVAFMEAADLSKARDGAEVAIGPGWAAVMCRHSATLYTRSTKKFGGGASEIGSENATEP
jgi:hypothetical protein